jgi:8-oxo-dGTP diphosphatase
MADTIKKTTHAAPTDDSGRADTGHALCGSDTGYVSTDPFQVDCTVCLLTVEPADETPETIRLTADVVLFGEFDGAVHVLLIERGWDPFKGRWALPGGHVDLGEDTEDAAHRELAEETGIRVGSLTFVSAYGTVGRDPRGRYVTFAYAGRMPHRLEPAAGDDAVRAEWVRLDRIVSGEVPLAFDHLEIVRDALRVTPLYTA